METSSDRPPESLEQANGRIWDMTLNLVHPAALYVVFQLMMVSRLEASPLLSHQGPLHVASLGIYTLQFLGAWAVFYTTLLRDMGLPCPYGTLLLAWSLVGLCLCYWVLPEPSEAPNGLVIAFLAAQLVPAAVAWIVTYVRWRRHQRTTAS